MLYKNNKFNMCICLNYLNYQFIYVLSLKNLYLIMLNLIHYEIGNYNNTY